MDPRLPALSPGARWALAALAGVLNGVAFIFWGPAALLANVPLLWALHGARSRWLTAGLGGLVGFLGGLHIYGILDYGQLLFWGFAGYTGSQMVLYALLHRALWGKLHPAADLALRYRQSDLPDGWVITGATFDAPAGDPAELTARMDEQLAKRDATQPTRDRTAGSTFRNPAGFSSTGRADDTHEMKAWALIDAAGMRGARVGGAQMSPMHANFMVNTGGATAADLESLGEEVRKRVFQNSAIELHWEIMRVGEPAPDA